MAKSKLMINDPSRHRIKNPKGNRQFLSPDAKKRLRGDKIKRKIGKKMNQSGYHSFGLPQAKEGSIWDRLMKRIRR